MSLTAALIAVPMQVSQLLNATVRDGYSQQIVVALLINYMQENDGKWPKSWDCLEPIFNRDQSRLKPGTFEELKKRVFIDFSADIDEMRECSLKYEKPTFRVIFAKFTWGFHPMGDPNFTIYHYLRKASLEVK